MFQTVPAMPEERAQFDQVAVNIAIEKATKAINSEREGDKEQAVLFYEQAIAVFNEQKGLAPAGMQAILEMYQTMYTEKVVQLK